MTAGKYWTFTIIFWLLAALLLLVNALQMDHWRQVAFRFYYIPVLGILLCSAQTLIYQSEGFRKLRYPQPWVVVFATVAAGLTTVTINLITYLLLNLDVANYHRELLHNGATTFIIIYLFWSFIWFELEGRPLLGSHPGPAGNHIDKITVDHRGETLELKVSNIEYFAASGDYVEIQLPGVSYLKKGTISALEELLDPQQFKRVHRSTMVNVNRISTTRPRPGGTFEIEFPSGHTVTSSRSYQAVLRELQT